MNQNSKIEEKVKITSGLPVLNFHAAGIDVGDGLHCVAVSDGKGCYKVLSTSAFTEDLREIVSFLKAHKITTVAMESTGVYWVQLYLMLEDAGFEVYLVNARHVKNVTGRKKDDTDAIWIQKLHTCGLLQKSYQPDREGRKLRDYVRHRRGLIQTNSENVNRMQKALELMNIKVHTVISDILGVSGMRMIRAILLGERNGERLYELCDSRIKASKAEILKSLDGIWKEEYLFMLAQAVEAYDFHQHQIKSCDDKIKQQLLAQVAKVNDGDISGLEDKDAVKEDCKKQDCKKQDKIKPETKEKKYKKNEYCFDVNQFLKKMTGVDLTKIPGMRDASALEFISEVGTDMSKWKSAKHFSAWLNLVPNTKISGGKVISSKMQKKKNNAGRCLRQVAATLSQNKSHLGDFYRKMRAKLGGKGAIVATANKISKIIFNMLSKKEEYKEEISQLNMEKRKQNRIEYLEKELQKLKKAA